jgi:signal transduction histidine kinase
MSKPAIICVDDEDIVLSSLEQQLKHRFISRCTIEVAEDAEFALEIIRELLYEQIEIPLIISDQIMPGMKGDELLKQVHVISPKTLTILLTGQADTIAIGNAVNYANLYRYISKPWAPEDLDLTIDKALEYYFQERKLEEQKTILEEMNITLKNANHCLKDKIKLRTKQLQHNNDKLEQEIFERKKIEQKLLLEKERANAANRAKSEFLANMSHEIRTPMNSILGFTEILESRIHDPQNKHYLSAVNTSGKALLTLINDILDISKVEAGKINLKYENININKIFFDIENIFYKKIIDKNLKLEININKTVPKLLILDEGRLRQILLNLIGNAVKFTNDNGHITVNVNVELSTVQKDKCDLIIAVKDNGIGIPKIEQNTIFESFAQSKNYINKYGGTGLGLTITKRLAELMGGKIYVDSQENIGSTFTVKFKNIGIATHTIDLNTITNNIDYDKIVFVKTKILIVDDVKSNRSVIKAYLSQYNFEFLEAENGQEGIDMAILHKPNIIFMDMKMPILNGEQTIKIIKADMQLKDIDVIVVTASAMKDVEIRLKKIAESYLIKPINKLELLTELSKFVKHNFTAKTTKFKIKKQCKCDGEILHELSILLNDELKTKWMQLDVNSSINKVEKFANELIELTKKYDCDFLFSWAKNLQTQALVFDIDNLFNTLKEFPAIIHEINNYKIDKV